ncbi:hypothetical protein BDV23DRAFT_88667 [Aspergillus alliaceus]|uniref:Uncharacterized protein n=1 Tax=Petromyces alliaceus TaxID=209559 RepID=A0A5N6FSA4_PETAA|nr:uncharacterized protein BDW43DRAFT_97607 [Aspergillus alliaceus]KAB8232896.1 hypothetical protein BDW43DRAFT_97607 [Aspergillus alliaceus]KAE8390261.1 hypothetical protein BDV23DRAFT_88667 [Aspergillus alliaceus]
MSVLFCSLDICWLLLSVCDRFQRLMVSFSFCPVWVPSFHLLCFLFLLLFFFFLYFIPLHILTPALECTITYLSLHEASVSTEPVNCYSSTILIEKELS